MTDDGLGLEDAYGATLDRIKRQGEEKARLGMAALMWISHAEPHFRADELCHALAVEIGSPNLSTDNVPSIGTLLDCCQGLVVLERKASTVRLIHFTLQEYLRAHPRIFPAAHKKIAETCLTYLNSQQVKAILASRSPDVQHTPFLEYSSLYWGVHAKRDFSDCAKLLALKLFNDYDRHISTKFLLIAQNLWGVDVHEFSGFSGLHCASFFGIVEIVASLLEIEGCDINKMDFTGSTPLLWASRSGHEGVVKMLLGRDGIRSDEPNVNGETPLHVAAWFGHEEVLKMLLGHGVNPDKSNLRDQTPLCLATRTGKEEVVKLLLEQDGVNPENQSIYGTPLYDAAQLGHEGVVKILLGRDDVNPNKPDNYGRTPILSAAYHGHQGVVKILLGRDDISPDKPNIDGRAPLWWAARDGHEGIVKMLLAQDVSPDKPDKAGQTPLFWAIENGHKGVIALLQPPRSATPTRSLPRRHIARFSPFYRR